MSLVNIRTISFTFAELEELIVALNLPASFVTSNRYHFNTLEAFALTCACFCSAGDQYNLAIIYNQSQSAISEIVNAVVTYVDVRWSFLLNFDHNHLLSQQNFDRYAKAIHWRGAPVKSI